MLLLDTEIKQKTKRKKIPKALIYEMKDGRPIYYRDYKKVIAGEKSLEEVMGSSFLQAKIIMIILKILFQKLDNKKYEILGNEIGYKWAPKSWRNLDIAIFEKDKILKETIDNHYIKTPPEVVIEVDTKADLTKYGDILNYMKEKIQDLLDSGVKKVIWFTTLDKKVMIAEANKPWLIDNWDNNIKIIDEISINLGKLLKIEGIE